jgi:biopolymer transport protein TolR
MALGTTDGESDLDISINLTALLDVLTNLLFFLMFGFAAQQASIELESNVELPLSTSQIAPKPSLQLTVSKTAIRVDREDVARVVSGRAEGERVEGRLEPLYRRLAKAKNDASAADVLLILCDKDTPYGLLREVLMTAGEAGFPKYRLAVITE